MTRRCGLAGGHYSAAPHGQITAVAAPVICCIYGKFQNSVGLGTSIFLADVVELMGEQRLPAGKEYKEPGSTMYKLDFMNSDVLPGGADALVLLAISGEAGIQSLETKAYDFAPNAASRPASDRIAVIAIEDRDIANVGRWPWPRDVHARMTEILAAARSKVVAHGTFFFEPSLEPGLLQHSR